MSRSYRGPADFEKSPSTGNWVVTGFLVGTISLIAGGAGFVMPHVINGEGMTKLTWDSLAGRPESKKKPKRKSSVNQTAFIPFGEVVVNLAEERLTRHLQVRITLLVNGADEELLEESLESNRAVLMNWLISYLSDKSLEEVRGAAGMNRARRDIQDRFNSLLFADGSEKVRDVLFEEFTVR